MSGRMTVNHIGQCVTDLDRSRRFYEDLLGFEHWRDLTLTDQPSDRLLGLEAPLGCRVCYLRRDGFVLELIHFAEPAHRHVPQRRAMDQPGLTHLSISCDIDAVRDRLAEYGGEVVSGTDLGVAVFVRDPDGQLVELLPLDYADRVADL